MSIAAAVLTAGGVALAAEAPPPRYPLRTDIPQWWQQIRGLYCPLTNSGAGGSLMKYNADKRDNFSSFLDLPNMLTDARRLGTNVVYLVDYWDPDYPHKSDYQPKAAWGGPAALTQGVDALHAAGGRIILYLEAFIIHRETLLGLTSGQDWAMMQIDPTIEACDPRLPPPGCWGPYDPPYHDAPYFYWYPYAGSLYQYYLMYPAAGSGWADYLVDLAGRMARDYHIDGVHLDSYGVHQLVADYHPDHPGGTEVGTFQAGAITLISRLREEMRRYVPDAIVMLEGSSFQDMLDVCDGSQFESLPKLRTDIPYAWTEPRQYPIYTSSWDLAEMQEILDEGHNLALSPWWFSRGSATVNALRTMCEQATNDADHDFIFLPGDNCPDTYNPTQTDADGDGFGDACDQCPYTFPGVPVDDTGCEIPVIPGDFDGDDDVDQTDLGYMQLCLTSNGIAQPAPECLPGRLDRDMDVDQQDMALFRGCLTGPGVPVNFDCLSQP